MAVSDAPGIINLLNFGVFYDEIGRVGREAADLLYYLLLLALAYVALLVIFLPL